MSITDEMNVDELRALAMRFPNVPIITMDENS